MAQRVTRREFLKGVGVGVAGASLAASAPARLFAGPYLRNRKLARRVLVLGIDGMDPNLVARFMDEGLLPTFKALGQRGHLGPLRTTIPPQSPVAWASFITGSNPGKHGIFDFVHRDPSSFTPYLSTSRSFPAERTLEVMDYVIPLESGRVELMRRGTPFWQHLEAHDIPADFSQLPANFPVQHSGTKALSGMGTPDLLGSYGTYTFITDMQNPPVKEDVGGRVQKVRVVDNVVKTSLGGPVNTFRTGDKPASVDFTVYRDANANVARIVLQDQELLLKTGEWSEWVPVRFDLVPALAKVRGMVRFYMQELHPHFRLYVSPINVDPVNPALPISCPAEHSAHLAERLGRFYTQGFPEDTKALSNGVFADDEFFTQAKIVLAERLHALDYELSQFKEGVLFFYFSTVDQNSHMLLRNMDPSHPLYDQAAKEEVRNAIRFCYQQMDEALKFALSKVDSDTTVIAMSDHGFAPFTREVHLSRLLAENGLTRLTDPGRAHTTDLYEAVDWRKTKAYVLGINGIYLNLAGREEQGIVSPSKAADVKREIIAKLADVVDPATGRKVFKNIYDTSEAYSGPYAGLAPDIIVGYDSGYRISDESVLGKFPRTLFGDRTNKWSSDHCMDPSVVPGVLISSKGINRTDPALWDLAPTILGEFGIDRSGEMDGRPLFI